MLELLQGLGSLQEQSTAHHESSWEEQPGPLALLAGTSLAQVP